MRGTKYVKWVGMAAILVAFVTFIQYQYHSAQREDNLAIDVNLNNNMENNIEAENADVTNNIKNKIDQGENVNLDNHVINNIDVTVDVHLSNNVENDVTGTNGGQETGKDRNGNTSNGDENGTKDASESGTGNGNKEDGTNNNGSTEENVWGVDSASITDNERISCVRNNFGEPKVWGRYLVDKNGVSFGLTEDEVNLLHDQGIKVLIIWNHFEDATGYDNGYAEANEAIQAAGDFGVPEGVALFADVEPIYPIDSGFIRGWYDAIEESAYEAGIYGIFDSDEELYQAFEAAAEENEVLLDDLYVWTASPNVGITTEENAPEYNPDSPESSTVIGWQYGIDSQSCNIDTNWFNGEYLDVLW